MPNPNKHNTPSNADWCNHGKGWAVDCADCGRLALHAFCPGLSNNAVRVRLEMLEHDLAESAAQAWRARE